MRTAYLSWLGLATCLASGGLQAQPVNENIARPEPGAGPAYSKISVAGRVLPAEAALGEQPDDWACTRDNRTGLVWEVKTTQGLRSLQHTYTWYDSGRAAGDRGVEQGEGRCAAGHACNTEEYITAVNADGGLCGATDWRLPARHELLAIVDYQRVGPAVDTAFFPNTMPAMYWTGTLYTKYRHSAWYVGFQHGSSGFFDRFEEGVHVRLVRGGP